MEGTQYEDENSFMIQTDNTNVRLTNTAVPLNTHNVKGQQYLDETVNSEYYQNNNNNTVRKPPQYVEHSGIMSTNNLMRMEGANSDIATTINWREELRRFYISINIAEKIPGNNSCILYSDLIISFYFTNLI